MKKILATLAVIAMASMVSAASFAWANNNKPTNCVKFDGATLTTGAAFTANLVYLGNTSLVDISAGTVVDTTTSLSGLGVYSSTFLNTYNEKIAGTEDAFVDGATFGVYLTYTDADGAVWYNYAQSTYTVTGLNAGGETAALTVFNQLGSDFGSWGWATSTGEVETLDTSKGGWQTVKTAVPEPATALIGLLGLGLMIKRRK